MEAVPSPGSVIASRFRVEGELGRGGMGVVLRGRDETDRPVAIKVMLPEAVDHPEAVPRFVNEARAARELTSEHAVRVLDCGTLENGLPYMVMELLEGQDLATQLEKGGPFSITDACDAVIDACDALAEAHARGMVHRDLKPANLFAARDPNGGRMRVKVLDFGVSKVAAQIRQMNLTSTGTALGTPHYMAPEQLKSAKGADARADVWSLGVVLYEILTGKLPFDGQSFGMLFMQIVAEEPKSVSTLRADIPPGLVEIVDRCMKKDREERYSDLAALVGSLARFASPSGQAAAKQVIEGRGTPQAPRDSSPSPEAPPQSSPVAPKFKGTMLMANAPSAIQQAREQVARAARASQPELPPYVPPQQTQQPHSSMGMVAAAPHHDSGRFSAPMPHAPQAPMPPMAAGAPAPAQQGGLSTGVLIGIVATCAVLVGVGLALLVLSRH